MIIRCSLSEHIVHYWLLADRKARAFMTVTRKETKVKPPGNIDETTVPGGVLELLQEAVANS